MKAGDDCVVPLCDAHHRQLHESGDEVGFLGSLDGPGLAELLYRHRYDINAAGAVLNEPPRRMG